MTYDGLARVGRCLLAGGVLVAAGCGDAMGPNPSFSTFSADVRGAMNERITGTASAGDDSWTRQFATELNVHGEAISVIALIGDGGQVISFTRPGTNLPLGTHKLGSVGTAAGMPKGGFASAYVLRKSDAFQVFFADSGSITLTDVGSRVSGTFTLYASSYRVFPVPTRETSGQPVTPVETGTGNISIAGSFAAARGPLR